MQIEWGKKRCSLNKSEASSIYFYWHTAWLKYWNANIWHISTGVTLCTLFNWFWNIDRLSLTRWTFSLGNVQNVKVESIGLCLLFNNEIQQKQKSWKIPRIDKLKWLIDEMKWLIDCFNERMNNCLINEGEIKIRVERFLSHLVETTTFIEESEKQLNKSSKTRRDEWWLISSLIRINDWWIEIFDR